MKRYSPQTSTTGKTSVEHTEPARAATSRSAANGSVCTTASTANTATTDGTNTIPVEISHANWARPSAYPTRSSPCRAGRSRA